MLRLRFSVNGWWECAGELWSSGRGPRSALGPR